MKYIFAFLLGLIFQVAAQESAVAQVKDADINTVIPGSREQFQGIRTFKTVLKGTLYRGGGSGGRIPLNESQLNALCKAGFSGAGYLYKTGMTNEQVVSCLNGSSHKNEMTYRFHGYRGQNDRYKTLQAIRDVIQGRRGPFFVHCWNGLHASGEISAVALMQFCGWTGARAAEYWKTNVPSSHEKYKHIYETHIPGFEPFENLKISAEDQRRICP